MIVIATDFGCEGPYLGQMKAILLREAPGIPVVDLFCNLPVFNTQAAAYLLAAYVAEFPIGSVFLCVVDPGVGGDRRAALIKADGRWFVGPDNGLFNIIARRAHDLEWRDISWRPERLSSSFHGRDVFAPVAARIARGELIPSTAVAAAERILPGWPDDLAQIIYVDHYGNLMTGVRAAGFSKDAIVFAGAARLSYARTFSAAARGAGFWYENANGLIEIAVNQGRASEALNLNVGDAVQVDAQGGQ